MMMMMNNKNSNLQQPVWAAKQYGPYRSPSATVDDVWISLFINDGWEEINFFATRKRECFVAFAFLKNKKMMRRDINNPIYQDKIKSLILLIIIIKIPKSEKGKIVFKISKVIILAI